MRDVLIADGLTKDYQGRRVVEGVSFELHPGTVTSFLGPNGAGKSTTLRMLTGLTSPSGGRSLIAGRPFAHWPNPAHLVGVLLDASTIHPGRTGLAHLRHACMTTGMPDARAEQVLDQLGLTDAARRRVATYSLGMRQRLGLAHAILADPPILVLDEPINGVDPAGIRSIRQMLRAHAARGGTVLLSSHMLSEVEDTADRVLIIAGGRIAADGTLDHLLGSSRSLVVGPDMQALADAFAAAGVRVTRGPENQILADATTEVVSGIAMRAGVMVTGITTERSSVEDLFFRLSAGGGAR